MPLPTESGVIAESLIINVGNSGWVSCAADIRTRVEPPMMMCAAEGAREGGVPDMVSARPPRVRVWEVMM